MNRLFLPTVYLTVFGMLPWSRLPDPVPPAGSLSPAGGTHAPALPRSVDYAPTDNEPFFPGGPAALAAYLQRADAYPPRAQAAELEGTVRVRFRVVPTGQLTDVRIAQSHGPVLDPAALRVVLLMPRWYPAHQSGVACLVELSIHFCFE